MTDQSCGGDSPLSVVGNVVGILTFVIAVAASIFAYVSSAKSATAELMEIVSELDTTGAFVKSMIEELEKEDASAADRQAKYKSYGRPMMELHDLSLQTRNSLEKLKHLTGYSYSWEEVTRRQRARGLLRWFYSKDELLQNVQKLRAKKSDIVTLHLIGSSKRALENEDLTKMMIAETRTQGTQLLQLQADLLHAFETGYAGRVAGHSQARRASTH